MIFEMRNFRCGLGTMDHVSGPQGLLILYLVIFHSVEPEVSPYFANEGIILNGILQLKCPPPPRKKKLQNFVNQCLGNVKYVLIMVDNNFKNFCNSCHFLQMAGY